MVSKQTWLGDAARRGRHWEGRLMGRLNGKVAVITGAASGIGRGTALCLAREGAAVVAADLNSQGGERVIGEIAAAGGRAVFQHTDVSSEPDIAAAVDRAVKEYGRLDVMFNNAGLVGAVGPIEAVSAEDWDRTIAVLLRSVFLGIKYAVDPMRKSGGGSIISTSSVASFLPSAYGAAYAAAKGAIISLTRSAALQLGRRRDRIAVLRQRNRPCDLVVQLAHVAGPVAPFEDIQ
jgi:NAD(P)-dependent dehydrogenase (short-subunit alcohol dehydrogenase family)